MAHRRVPQTVKIRYTWSRFARNPVEHVYDAADEFIRPLCGTALVVAYQTIADQPSGLARVCPRCTTRLAKIRVMNARLAK